NTFTWAPASPTSTPRLVGASPSTITKASPATPPARSCGSSSADTSPSAVWPRTSTRAVKKRSTGSKGKGRNNEASRRAVVTSERLDHGRQRGRVGDQVDVPAGMKIQRRVRQQARHDACIDHRDDRVVGAGKDQRVLPDQRQREQACPYRSGQQLMHVPDPRAGHQRAAGQGLPGRRTRRSFFSRPPSTAARYGNPYGSSETGDAPLPGTSNRTTVLFGFRCSTSGSNTSRLAPIPLHSTSGTPSPQRMLTRICWPRTGTSCSTLSLSENA